MKSNSYRFGQYYFKAYCKTVGQGWEVSVHWDKKCIFIGNFIHKAEATAWWNILNKEIKNFTRTYWISSRSAKTWYGHFFSNHLYKTYYSFLDKVFVKYNRTFKSAFSKDVRRYNYLKRNMDRGERFFLTRAA